MPEDHLQIQSSDYEVTLHPAFASRVTVSKAGGESRELYHQRQPYNLAGRGMPKRHLIRIKGGTHGQDITLTLDDPNHRIAGITVELYAEDASPGSGLSTEVRETVEIKGDASTCPPYCEPV